LKYISRFLSQINELKSKLALAESQLDKREKKLQELEKERRILIQVEYRREGSLFR
jgi:hypothetical protein